MDLLFGDVVLGDEDEVADGVVDWFVGGGCTGPLHLFMHCGLFKQLGTKERDNQVTVLRQTYP